MGENEIDFYHLMLFFYFRKAKKTLYKQQSRYEPFMKKVSELRVNLDGRERSSRSVVDNAQIETQI